MAQNTSTAYSKRAEEMRNAYKQKVQDSRKRYETYRDQVNRAYAEKLRGEWESFTAGYEEEDSLKQKKELEPVVYEKQDGDRTSSEIVADEVATDFLFFFSKAEPVDDILEVKDAGDTEEYVEFTFYGTPVSIRVTKERPHLKVCSGHEVASMWEELSGRKFNNTVFDCFQAKKSLNLCDWAYLQLLDSLSHNVYKNDNNSANLLIGYVYAQSGYKIKFAHNNGKLFLLYASVAPLKRHSFIDVAGTRYYFYNAKTSVSTIIRREFPVSKAAMKNEAPVSFSIEKNQNFNFAAIDFRKIESNYSGGISASVSSNSNLISFYDSYPAFNSSEGSAYQWLYHANTPLSERSKRELYPSIEKFVEGKDTLTALNGILNFLQFGLTYKIDKEVWGGDRVFFAEETLYYPYCDCEDRAILFSRIVRDVLHMDVVLVHYPNHLGCAVKIDKNVFIPGDYLIFENNKYLVCDPSYIGAPAGETIPTLKDAQVKIVKLR